MTAKRYSNPFDQLTVKTRWQSRLSRWRDALLRPVRPSRIKPDRAGPPNLLLIGIDTLRADHLGLGGYSQPTSPCLDQLGARGTIFADVTAPAPWTLPSFASALTARMPGLHGGYLPGAVRNMDNQPPGRLHEDLPTLASHMKSLGYQTAAFYSNQFFAFGLAESFDHHVYVNRPAGEVARLANEWMRRHAGGPFFCFVLLNDPHEPTTPDGDDLAPFLPALAAQGVPSDDDALRPYIRWGEKPGLDLTRAAFPADTATDHARAIKLAIYDGTIHYVDRVIGTLQDTLKARGLDHNTVVSVFSDHGEEFLDHAALAHQWGHDPRGIHGIGHGHAHFQEVLQVPWLAWGPGVPAGTRVRQPVSLLDLSPTLLEWLGLPPLSDLERAASAAGEWGASLVGKSVADGSAEPARLILSEAIAYGPDLVALRQDNLKLIAHRDGRVLALFDLAADPGETRDLAAERPEVMTGLLDHLAHWRQSGLGATGKQDGSWDDMDDTIRQRLKDLGYSE
jgi:arylsulfatase A-like enzyme